MNITFIILYSCTAIEITTTTGTRGGGTATEKGTGIGTVIIGERGVPPGTSTARKEGGHVRIQTPGTTKKAGVDRGKKDPTWRTTKEER